MLLQEPTEFDLGAVLPTGAVVSQDEVRVAVVEHSQLAQRVRHCLIGSGYLGKAGGTTSGEFQKTYYISTGVYSEN